MASRNLVANGSGGRKGGVSDFVQFDDETILWTASLILLKHLQRPELRQQLRGKRVLELGSGLGHLGLGMAALGAHVTCTERPQELPHLEANLAKHAATREQQQGGAGALSILDEALLLLRPPEAAADEGTKQPAAGQGTTEAQSAQEAASATSGGGEALQGSVQAVALEWGQDGFSRSPLGTQQLPAFDLIIMSELFYIERLFPDLLWTLRRFAGPQTVVWSIFIDRPFSFTFFALMHDEGCWEVEQVEEFDDLGLDKELQVHMHRITLKAA